MNPEANSRLPSAAQAVAARALMLWAASLIRNVLPPNEVEREQSIEVLNKKLSKIREEFSQIAFPEMSPVESDMWSQESLEAFDDLASQFIQKVLAQN